MVHTTKLIIALALLTEVGVSTGNTEEPTVATKNRAVDFERHVAPLLGKHGCNLGSCHGSPEGQGDFKLSLFGADMKADYEAICAEEAARINADDPASSLLLEKPTLRADHGGGQRFSDSSIAFATVRRWIAQGAKHRPGSGAIQRIDCQPSTILLPANSPPVGAQVFATFSDGTSENVTAFCDFRSQDQTIATVEASLIRPIGTGDTHMIAVYRGHPASISVLVPNVANRSKVAAAFADYQLRNCIDDQIAAKLQSLGIEPSPRCNDVVFLRRVTLATVGQLPTPEQIRHFVNSSRADKRLRKIDGLLADPLHASLWATRMCEIMGSRDRGNARMTAEDDRRQWQWHEWFRRRFAGNLAYDQIVHGILVATTLDGNALDQFIADHAVAERLDDDPKAHAEFYARRRTLDLFWQRPEVNEEIELDTLTERIAAAFLGVRMECARCHKHPFDRWTQNDHRALANIFSQVRFGLSPQSRSEVFDLLQQQREARKQGLPTKTIPAIQEVFLTESPKDRRAVASNHKLAPRPLGGLPIPLTGDRRKRFADWLTDADNTMFSRNLVNRVWQWYFGRGLVEPVDAFSAANPSTHPELLNELAENFIRSGFDVRQLEREILMSRTWQTSAMPTKSNANDERTFARAYVTPLRAEVLVDAIRFATGNSFSDFDLAGHHLPAVAIPVARSGNPQLDAWFDIFRRPERTLTCDCEQQFEPTLRQRMLLLSDQQLISSIRQGNVQRLTEQQPTNEELVEELFLRTLSRWPSQSELDAAMGAFETASDQRAAAEDILWSLINTREFSTNH